MKSQYDKIKTVIDQSSQMVDIDKFLIMKFYNRLEQGNLVRDENQKDHFSTFFMPIVLKNKMIFLGDHIKSGMWLVPGGHIDKNESPFETAIREVQEELDVTITENALELFDLSITDINSSYPCKRHYDIWYLYTLSEPVVFNYTREEYKSAEWVPIEEAIKRTQNKNQKAVLKKLYKKFFS